MSLAVNDTLIAVGGNFTAISDVSRPHLAVYVKDPSPPTVIIPSASSLRINGYPNPSVSGITIALPQDDIRNILMCNREGRIVTPSYQMEEHSITIHTERLQTGEYFVRLEAADGTSYLSTFMRL